MSVMQVRVWGVLIVLVLINVWLVESQPMPGSQMRRRPINRPGGRSHFQLPGEKVWLFAVDGRRKPFSFLSEDGTLKGFTVDFIAEVCREARKKCKMVLAPFTECTFTEREINYPGRGLMGEWFDACPGYGITLDRVSAFDFTAPYLNTDASFAVLPGNPDSFDPLADDYRNYTLIHLTGAATNEKCLYRIGKKFGNVTIAQDLPDAKQRLLNGEANVLFSPRSNITDLEVLPERFHCDISGSGIMVKRGSQLTQWWNPSFNKLLRRGSYTRFCAQATKKYRYDFNCISRTKVYQHHSRSEKFTNFRRKGLWL